MKAYEVYALLTDAAKQTTLRRVCAALADQHGENRSPDYIKQVILGLRKNTVSDNVARAISAHFTGYVGIRVDPDEVCPREEAAHEPREKKR